MKDLFLLSRYNRKAEIARQELLQEKQQQFNKLKKRKKKLTLINSLSKFFNSINHLEEGEANRKEIIHTF